MGRAMAARTTSTLAGSTGSGDQTEPLALDRTAQQPSLDGNTVEIEREQTEFSANALRYQASLRFLDGKVKSLKLAIKGTA